MPNLKAQPRLTSFAPQFLVDDLVQLDDLLPEAWF